MKLSISKKFAKRSIKCLALFAPLAYLFGSLFFGLNGSHSSFPYAEPVYAEEYVSVDSLGDDLSNYRVVVSDATYFFNYVKGLVPNGAGNVLVHFDYLDLEYYRFSVYSSVIGCYEHLADNSGNSNIIYNNGPTAGNALPWYFYPYNMSDFNLFLAGGGSLECLMSIPTDVVPENNGANSDYVFGQFFAKDNFLQKWGENCISENPVGFAPFGTFFKFIDENMLHLSDSQIGLMGYGYIYYCLHILIAFLAFDCVAFIPMLIKKVVYQFNKGVSDDD